MINCIVSESTVGGGGAFLPDFTLRVEAVCSPAPLLQLHGANTFSPQQNPIKGTITSWTILQICLHSSLIMKCVVKAWVSDYPRQTRTQTHTVVLIWDSVLVAPVTATDMCQLRKFSSVTHTKPNAQPLLSVN